VTLHRRRFRRGAYQEDGERERVEAIVRRVARRCGVTGRDRYRARAGAEGEAASEVDAGASAVREPGGRAEPAEHGRQLRLL
jgi:hypothetical protein